MEENRLFSDYSATPRTLVSLRHDLVSTVTMAVVSDRRRVSSIHFTVNKIIHDYAVQAKHILKY